MDYAFKYTEKNPLETETDYPYIGIDADCSFKAEKGKVRAKGYTDVPPNDPTQMKAALKLGPVAVGIQADSKHF
jgi:hypothetical protein